MRESGPALPFARVRDSIRASRCGMAERNPEPALETKLDSIVPVLHQPQMSRLRMAQDWTLHRNRQPLT